MAQIRHRVTRVNRATKTGTCSICGPVNVSVGPKYKGRSYWRCAQARKWDETSRWRTDESVREAQRNARLLREYGITAEQYDAMLIAQGGVCHRCQQPPTEMMRLAVDHNHDTGAVRKLLCGPCNTYLGRLEANLDRLATDLSYLDTGLSRELADVISARLADSPIAGW